MPPTHHERQAAHEALRDAFGDHTDAVIDFLRPDDSHLATNLDVAGVRSEMAGMRGEMAQLRAHVDTGLSAVRTEMAETRRSITVEIHQALAGQTRAMTIGLVAAVILVAISKLAGG